MEPKLRLRKGGSYAKNGGEIEISGVLRERRKADGRRRLQLTQNEREDFRLRERIERAIALYLDLEQPHTQAEIAAALGISLPALKDLTRTKPFMDAYNAHFLELGHDPRLKLTQAAIADMLPTAVNALRNLITEERTPAGIKLQAIKEIFARAGIAAPDKAGNDRGELAEFLKKAGLKELSVGLQFGDEDSGIEGVVVEGQVISREEPGLLPKDIPA